MSFQFSKTTLLLTAAGLLSACSSIANKSPDEMVRYGVQRHFVHDNQYNFSGQYRVKIIPATPPAVAAANTREAAMQSQVATNAAINAAVAVPPAKYPHARNKRRVEVRQERTVEFNRKLEQAEADHVNYEKTALHYYIQNVQQVLSSHISAPYHGALDLPQGRFEVVPQVRYQTRNALAQIQVPVQASVRDMAVVVDPGAIAPWWDAYAKVKRPNAVIGDHYLAVQLPRQDYQNLPLRQFVRAVPKAVDDGYAAISKQAFTQLPLDDAGRQVKARYKVRLSITPAQSDQITKVMLSSLSAQLKQDEASGQQNNHNKMPDYAAMQRLLQKVGQFLQEDTSDSDNNVVLQRLRQQPVVTDFYLDWRGRIKAIRQTLNLTPLARYIGSHNHVYVTSWTQLDYTHQPKFVLQPNAANTLDLTQKIEALRNAPTNAHSAAGADRIIQALLDLQREHPNQIQVRVH